MACRNYDCLWIRSDLPDQYRPDRCWMVLERIGDDVIIAICDLDHPDAWEEPSNRALLQELLDAGNKLLVITGSKLVFMPAEDAQVILDTITRHANAKLG